MYSFDEDGAIPFTNSKSQLVEKINGNIGKKWSKTFILRSFENVDFDIDQNRVFSAPGIAN